MKATGSYRGKPAVMTFDERARFLSIKSPKGLREYAAHYVDSRSPSASLHDGRLVWNNLVFDLANGPEDEELALQIVRAVEEARNRHGISRSSRDPSTQATKSLSPTERAARIAKAVESFAWVLLVAGIVGGAVLAWTTRTVCTSEFSCNATHPFIGLGIGVGVSAAFQSAVVVMISAYIQARTTTSYEP
jgi:hypothetical protein